MEMKDDTPILRCKCGSSKVYVKGADMCVRAFKLSVELQQNAL